MIPLFLIILSGCFGINLAVLYGVDSVKSSPLELSHICRMYDVGNSISGS